MNNMKRYVIGLDFGTLSARGVLMDVSDGRVIAEASESYIHGVMDRTLPDGTPLPPEWALQDPSDYVAALDRVMPPLAEAAAGGEVIGIGVDTTTSTCTPLDAQGVPLSVRYPDRPHAYTVLWKHHAAGRQAVDFERAAREKHAPWLQYYGDTVNLEGFWPKLLQLYDEAPDLYAQADTYVDFPDLMVLYLTGRLTRSEMVLALKVYYSQGECPSREVLSAARPGFESALEKLRGDIVPASRPAGRLRDKLAARWGLNGGITVASGILDAHAGLLSAGVISPETCLAALGTSGCYICPAEKLVPVPGITGSLSRGLVNMPLYEAGQSCVGDGFAWFERQLVPDDVRVRAAEAGLGVQSYLTDLARKLAPGQTGLIALDWWNGNRSILNDASLTGLIIGLTLRTRPEEIYRAFLESAAFGARMIIENYQRHGVPVKRLVLGGGIPQKNTLLCQLYADVLHMECLVPDGGQSTAAGSAISAAIAAGAYPDEPAAVRAMVPERYTVYAPDPADGAVYDRLYAVYAELSAQYGQTARNAMRQLRQIQENP